MERVLSVVPLLFTTTQECAAAVGTVVAISAVLYAILPGQTVNGYVCTQKKPFEPLRYRLTGLATHVVVSIGFIALGVAGVVDGEFFYHNFWPCLAASNIFGLVLAAILVAWGYMRKPEDQERARRAVTADMKDKPMQVCVEQPPWSNVFEQYYIGTIFNPRIGSMFDIKMYLYVVGAVTVQLVLISAVFAHINLSSSSSPTRAIVVYSFLLTFFLVEYMYHEHVHLYTYDLFAEKVGFKLVWGCLVFYSYFYAIGVWPLVDGDSTAYDDSTAGDDSNARSDLSLLSSVSIVILFALGWFLTRGANLQKYQFKRDPEKPFFGIKPETIEGTRILTSGFWRFARHINYLGEIIQAIALALPAHLTTDSRISWLYPLYYILLLVPRQFEDDRLCSQKYGRKWHQYTVRVPYRIIPFVF